MSIARTTTRTNGAASQLSLTLYVAGDNAFSRIAEANLRSIMLEMQLHAAITTVNVLQHPELTLKKRIFATPALVVSNGGAESLIVGDFSERDKISGVLRNFTQGMAGSAGSPKQALR